MTTDMKANTPKRITLGAITLQSFGLEKKSRNHRGIHHSSPYFSLRECTHN